MTYTEEAKQALSRKVAEKIGIEPCKKGYFGITPEECQEYDWLHDDWHTLCEECNKRGIWVKRCHSIDGFAWYEAYTNDVFTLDQWLCSVEIADCASPSEAERISRLLALGEI